MARVLLKVETVLNNQVLMYTIQDVMTRGFCFSQRRCSRCQPSGMLCFVDW
jgi:hypothetical protein